MLMEDVYKKDEFSQLLLKNHEKFSVQIGLSASIHQMSLKLWMALYDLNPEMESEATQWFAAIIFATALNDRSSPDVRLMVNLTTLLRKSSMPVIALLEKLKQLRELVSLSKRSVSGILTFQRRFCVTAAVFDKFCKVYSQVFVVDETRFNDEIDANYVYDVPETKQACWLVYLLAKDELTAAHTELFLAFQVLLCSIEFVMKSTPKFLLQPFFEDAIDRESQLVDAFEEISPTLKLLCTKYGCDFSEMALVKKRLDATFFPSFSKPNQNGHSASSKHGSNEVTVPNSNELHARYWEILDRYFELDETLFLAGDILVKLSNSPALQCTATRNPADVPFRGKPQGWDDTVPSALEKELKRISDAVLSRYELFLRNLISEALSRKSESLSKVVTVDQMMSTVLSLFPHALKSYLMKFDNKRGISAREQLSENQAASLLASCAIACLSDVFTLLNDNPESQIEDEIALEVLRYLEVSYVKFACDVEPLVHMSNLFSDSQLSRLKFVEERILESHLWKDGSFIRKFSKQGDKVSNFALENGLKVAYQDLAKIANKVCRLAYKRLQQLSKLLAIGAELESKIWECIEHCLFEKTFLLKNRHLDQIIMSSIYAICKVCDQERKFKYITQAYRKIPNTAADVFKKTLIVPENKDSVDSIIAFYNQVFMLCMKSFILKFSKSKDPSQEKQMGAVNVLKRVNPNVLARNALNKPGAVHPPPAITKVPLYVAETPEHWPVVAGGHPSEQQLPMRLLASAIVAKKSSEPNTSWNTVFPSKSKYRSREPPLRKGHRSSSSGVAVNEETKSWAAETDESSESSEDEEEAITNRGIYEKMLSNRFRPR